MRKSVIMKPFEHLLKYKKYKNDYADENNQKTFNCDKQPKDKFLKQYKWICRHFLSHSLGNFYSANHHMQLKLYTLQMSLAGKLKKQTRIIHKAIVQ